MYFVILVNVLFIFAQREREISNFLYCHLPRYYCICFQETRKCIVKVESGSHLI